MEQVCKHCGANLNTEYYKLHSANNADWLYCSGKCLDAFDKKIKEGTEQTTLLHPDEINPFAILRGLVFAVAMVGGAIVLLCLGVSPFDLLISIADLFGSMLSAAGC
jgi:hypothetical protein